MSDTYTKLFSSITESTVWGEPYSIRVVWVTMLAMADARGEVHGSIPGLARRANVALEEAEGALQAFMSPDPYSRTRDEDGRRIVEIDGGWRLINHSKYSAVRNAEERRAYKRRWDRDNRSESDKSDKSDKSDTNPTNPTGPTPPTPTPAPSKSKSKELSAQPAASRFGDWWAAWPSKKKVGRKKAEQLWRRRNLDPIADALIADVLHRVANDDGWMRGYAPDPTTYINQDRWEDAIRAPPRAAAPAAAPSKTLTAMQALQGMKNGNGNELVRERGHQRLDQAPVLELGRDTFARLDPGHGGDVD